MFRFSCNFLDLFLPIAKNTNGLFFSCPYNALDPGDGTNSNALKICRKNWIKLHKSVGTN